MNDFVIKTHNLSKVYKLYEKNSDRLKEALNPFGKKYHSIFDALSSISFTVGKGEVLGIIGRNGAGKSTLLKIISGILTQSKGQCIVKGRVSALLELGTGFNPELTGIENIHFNSIIKGFSTEEIKAKMGRIIDFADIGQFMYQPIKMYSSGMRARLGFAMAIHIDPEILVVDEALSVGDELFKRKCYARMQQFLDEGKTILFVTHSLSTINELCTRAILLDKGELILDGHPKFVTTHYLKLLYSTLRERPFVRESIVKLNSDIEKKEEYSRTLIDEELEIESDKLSYDNDRKKLEVGNMEPFYIESFQSQTEIKHKCPAVDIFDLEIQTPEGRKVNALVMNEDYICTFKIRFNVSMQFVSLNVKIRSIKGINIAGIRFPKNNSDFPHVKKGESYRFDWRFTCRLVPKSYFINITLGNFSNGEKNQILHLADALAFKVQDMEHCSLGIVDLDNTCQLTRLDAADRAIIHKMRPETDIFSKTFFIGGPPRSGTTFIASFLNKHSSVFTAIDDHVCECWDLYYYRTRVGLLREIREGRVDSQRFHQILTNRLLEGDALKGIAPSPKVAQMAFEPPPQRPGEPTIDADLKLQRHRVPLESLPQGFKLCLKSPEISFFLQDLEEIFPEVGFILVYRPLVEIAESMYRKGHTVKKVAVFHREWREETTLDGKSIPPPGVAAQWNHLWGEATDFQRCVIYAASHLKALLTGITAIKAKKTFVYNHADLRRQPRDILRGMALFMNIDPAGFQDPAGILNTEEPHIPLELKREMVDLEKELDLCRLELEMKNLHSLW